MMVASAALVTERHPITEAVAAVALAVRMAQAIMASTLQPRRAAPAARAMQAAAARAARRELVPAQQATVGLQRLGHKQATVQQLDRAAVAAVRTTRVFQGTAATAAITVAAVAAVANLLASTQRAARAAKD